MTTAIIVVLIALAARQLIYWKFGAEIDRWADRQGQRLLAFVKAHTGAKS